MKLGGFLRTMAGRLIAAAAAVAVLTSAALAEAPPKRHFIVLIRTTNDMQDKAFGRVRDLLVAGLYGKYAGEYRFDPNNDIMSVAYYSLSKEPYGDGAICPVNNGPEGKISGKVLNGRHLFDWTVTGKALSYAELAGILNRDLDPSKKFCRYAEKSTPNTAMIRTLALVDINKRLPPGDLFDQVIIANVSMNASNVNPNDELGALRHSGYQVEGVQDLITSVQKYFYFREDLELVQDNRPEGNSWPIIPPGRLQDEYNSWTVNPQRGQNKEYPFFLLIAELRSTITSPEPVVPEAIFAEPRAVDSNGTIKVKQASAEPAGVTIRNTSQSWQLLSGTWITEQDGQSTLFGPDGSPLSTRRVDVLNCDGTACLKQKDTISLPLLAGVGLTEPGAPGEWKAPYGKAWFSAELKYLAPGIYDHFVHHTEARPVRVGARPMPELHSGILPPSKVNATDLTHQWQSEDAERGGLSIDDAASRMEGARALWSWIYTLIGFVLLGGALAVWWYFLPGRGFRPRLSWRPATDPVLIDFNASGQQTVLLGTVVLTNTGIATGLSAIVGRSQPERRSMTIDLSMEDLAAHSFVFAKAGEAGSPVLGFFRPSDGEASSSSSASLSLQWAGDSAAAQELLVFLARDQIADFSGDPQSGTAAVVINMPLKARWQRHNVRLNGVIDRLPRQLRDKAAVYWPRCQDQACDYTITLNLAIKPKEAVLPTVEFKAADGKAFYSNDPDRAGSDDVELGCYVFQSPETLHFARTFVGDFALTAQIEGRKVSERAVSLRQNRIALKPGATIDDPVIVHCNCDEVVNPTPPCHRISFQCLGPTEAGSDLTLKVVELFRDPTISGLDVAINPSWGDQAKDVYWNTDGQLYWRFSRLSPAPENRAHSDRISLGSRAVRFGRGEHTQYPIAVLQLRNPAKNGKGRVSIELTPHLNLADAYGDAIHNRSGGIINPDTLVKVFDRNCDQIIDGPLVLTEGDADREVELIFQTESVFDIDGGVIPADKAVATIDFKVAIWTDEQILAGVKRESVIRHCTLETPLIVELLPPDVWLCIDFGTSAIAVARNDAKGGQLDILNLQTAKQRSQRRKDFCFAKFDEANPELGTPFLPSSVVFDADLRQDGSKSDGEPGFPNFAPASLTPGDSSFVSLPASLHSDSQRNWRTVYSLKSWFSTGSNRIVLDGKIKLQDGAGKTTYETDEVAMKDAIASTLAALADAYIRPQSADGMEAGRIILTHPNTLTPILVEEFLNVACSVLQKRFRIPVKDRITAVSESDAVAYYYVGKLRNKLPPEVDTLLVYDFGAGTTDISIVRIEWEHGVIPHPKSWTTLARLGIPIAGNYIDKLLARIVDEAIKNETLTDHTVWNYQYPIVANMLVDDGINRFEEYHISAIRDFWRCLRQAKHAVAKGQERYDGADFVIKLSGGEAMRADQSILKYVGDSNNYNGDKEKTAVQKGEKQFALISIAASAVFESDAITAFIDFVTKDLIEEALKIANVDSAAITSVVVSGRGALWPGLRHAVWAQFPNAAKPDLLSDGSSDQMKYAVVEGAIEFQRISKGRKFRRDDTALRPKLAIVLDLGHDTHRLITEDDWNGKWLDIAGIYRGCVYQYAHDNPQASDFDGYRKYFYSAVPSSGELFRDSFAFDGRVLLTRQNLPNGGYVIEAKSSDNTIIRLGNKLDMLDTTASRPDWPIGSVLISPNDK